MCKHINYEYICEELFPANINLNIAVQVQYSFIFLKHYQIKLYISLWF